MTEVTSVLGFFINEQPDTVEKFTRAIQKAQHWVYGNSSEEVAKVIQPFFEDTDVALIAKVVERYKKQASFAKTPVLDQSEWNHLQRVMDTAGQLPKRIDYDELVDPSYAEKAAK